MCELAVSTPQLLIVKLVQIRNLRVRSRKVYFMNVTNWVYAYLTCLGLENIG